MKAGLQTAHPAQPHPAAVGGKVMGDGQPHTIRDGARACIWAGSMRKHPQGVSEPVTVTRDIYNRVWRRVSHRITLMLWHQRCRDKAAVWDGFVDAHTPLVFASVQGCWLRRSTLLEDLPSQDNVECCSLWNSFGIL